MYNKLAAIQNELKVPKNQTNTFGNYKYRSCEDIVEAVKPLCEKHEVLLTLSDEVVAVGDRTFVKATATLAGLEVGDEGLPYSLVEVYGWAEIATEKKGMDVAQITGAASSYARKYALNGLFAIDDTKDADATNKHETQLPKEELDLD